MGQTNQEIKKRHFKKVYDNAEMICCGCGCGKQIKNKDKYGRDKKFISGHNNRKYKDLTQHKREWNHRNRESRYESKVQRGHRLKARVIQHLDNKCVKCGLSYNGKNACIFQTHHKNPTQKNFSINTRTLINYAWKKILEEMNKCVLMCANCHFQEHNEEY